MIDEHYKIVAKRMSERLNSGESEQKIRKYLISTCSWSREEAEKIIKIAKEKTI